MSDDRIKRAFKLVKLDILNQSKEVEKLSELQKKSYSEIRAELKSGFSGIEKTNKNLAIIAKELLSLKTDVKEVNGKTTKLEKESCSVQHSFYTRKLSTLMIWGSFITLGAGIASIFFQAFSFMSGFVIASIFLFLLGIGGKLLGLTKNPDMS